MATEKLLDGKVALVTGAGRGVGRDVSLLIAEHGAKVLVNDLGGSLGGEGADDTPAQQVVDEIKAMGGDAAANYKSVAGFGAAQEMVDQAYEELGRARHRGQQCRHSARRDLPQDD